MSRVPRNLTGDPTKSNETRLFTLLIITDRAVKQVLFLSISQPFTNVELALSREVQRNGKRIMLYLTFKGLDTPKTAASFLHAFL